jgi:CheY-like chemotaxis protein
LDRTLKSSSQQFALVVESDDQVRLHMADALASRGYVVHTSKSAEAALALTLQVAFGLIVVGSSEFASAGPAVRALLRSEGIRQAVVFHDKGQGGDPSGMVLSTVVEIGSQDDPISRLLMVVPSAESTHLRQQES